MTEVDHDAIAKQLVDAQKAGKLPTVTRKLNHEISEATILALSKLLIPAIHANIPRAKKIYELQAYVASLLGTKLSEGYLKSQLAILKASTGEIENALEIFEELRFSYDIYFEDVYKLGLYANIVATYVSLGMREKAEMLAKNIRDGQLKVGKKGLNALARAEGSLGILYHNIGKLNLALIAFEKAEEIFLAIGKDLHRLNVLNSLAIVLRDQGKYNRSQAVFGRIKKDYEKLGLHHLVANTLKNLAIIQAQLGKFHEANNLFQSARELYEQKRLFGKVAEVDLFQAQHFIQFRLAADAYKLANSAQTLQKLHGGTYWDKCLAKLISGLALKIMGKTAESKAELLVALEQYSKAGASQYAYRASLALANLNNLSESEVKQISATIIRPNFDNISLTNTLSFSKMMMLLGNSELAIDKVLTVFDSKTTLSAEQYILACQILGASYKDLQNWEKAWHWLMNSITKLDEIIRHIYSDELRTTLIDNHSKIFQDLIDVAFARVKTNSNFLPDLLDAVNRDTRYLVTPKQCVTSNSSQSRNSQKKLEALREKWYWNSQQDAGYWNVPPGHKTLPKPMATEQVRLEHEIIALSRNLRPGNADPKVSCSDNQGLLIDSLSHLQAGITPSEMRLQIFINQGFCHALIITKEAISFVDFLAPTTEINRFLKHWRFMVKNRHFFESNASVIEILQKFYASLFIRLPLPVTIKHLSVSLPSIWHDLPVHAFHDGERFLLETIDVSFKICPLFVNKRPKSFKQGVLIGNSAKGKLGETVSEVSLLQKKLKRVGINSKLTLGEISQERFCNLIMDADLVHIASHGTCRQDNALFALLHISSPPISALEIAVMNASSTSMVFLNSCCTGLGTASEGSVNGFARSFLIAGVVDVVVTLWEIEDSFAKTFTEGFYDQFFSSNGGVPSPTLNNLQRKHINQGISIFNWATYVVWRK